MTLEIAVVDGLTPSTTGTLDLTVSGFGTPVAAIFLSGRGRNDDTVLASATRWSVGFTDGSNERVSAGSSKSGDSTSNTWRSQTANGRVVQILTTGGTASVDKYGTFNSWITDGVRLNWTLASGTAQHEVVCVLIKGVSAKVGDVTLNATQDAATTLGSLGFDPEILFIASAGLGSNSTTPSTHNIGAYGCAYKNGGTIQQRSIAFYDVDNLSTTKTGTAYFDNRVISQVSNDSISYTAEVTDFGTSDFEITTRDGGSGSDIIAYLALSDPGVDVDLQEFTSKTSTGTVKNTTTFAPEAIIGAFADGTDTANAVKAGGEGWCVFGANKTGSVEKCHSFYSVDALSTSASGAIADSTVLNWGTGSSYSKEIEAVVDSWNSDGVTLDYTTIAGGATTARKFWGLIIGAATGTTADEDAVFFGSNF